MDNNNRRIYILLCGTGTLFSKAIQYKTKDSCPHVSLILDSDFKHGYSFGRKFLRNPLIGGFKVEDYSSWLTVFKRIDCELYYIDIDEDKYENLLNLLDTFYKNRHRYSYNIVGVIGQALGIDINVKNSFFCSQFVSYVLSECEIIDLGVIPLHSKAENFRNSLSHNKLFEGDLSSLINKDKINNSKVLESGLDIV